MSRSRREPLPAVVVGGSLNGLGVVRSLARGRMPIYLLETTRRCVAAWSRHCEYVPVASLGERALIDALVILAHRLRCRPVLILTSDESVNTVSACRGEIEPLYRVNLPADDVLRVLADKTLFHQLAEREGFAVPRSVCIEDAGGLERIGTLRPPLIMKPADKTLVLNGIAERAVLAQTVPEAQRDAARMLGSALRIIVQEWVDGPDTELYFTLFSCDHDGKLLGLFPGRKLRSAPPAIGSTAVCVPAPEAASELFPPTMQFIARVVYRGLGSLEFKRDRRSGRFLMIEPTVGRTDWQEEIATLCGVNLPLLTYLSELRMALPPPRDSFRQIAWRSSAGFRVPLPIGMRTVDGSLRWSDPLPALYHYGYEGLLMRLWRRMSGVLARRMGSLAA